MSGDWDNLRVFLALAEEGNLTAAAKRLRVSHPTVARRIKALEDAMGFRLFERLPEGFQPTEQALNLIEEARQMEQAAQAIERRAAGLGNTHLGSVRISVDETLADFLGRHLMALRENHRCIEFEIAVNHISANLSRREADLSIRPQVPELASLVRRKLGSFAYAVYGTGAFAGQWDGSDEALKALPWIGFDEDHSYMPGQAWQLAFLGERRAEVRTNNGMVLARAIRDGNGIGVLPCFFGDGDPALQRMTPPVETATHWLLVHADLRQVPRVRIVIDALVELFQDKRAEIEGTQVAPLLPLRRSA
ncbi:MAG: LysR family transcriptional regulator [Rhodospirillales bacterium]